MQHSRLFGRTLALIAVITGITAALPARDATRVPRPGQTAAEDTRERAYRANNRGVALLEQFDYASAETAFREALAIEPTLALARLNLAIALLYSGNVAGAIDEAGRAVKELPDAPQAAYVLGLAARADNRLEDAVRAFNRVLALDADDTGARIHLAQMHLQERRYGEALSLAQEALSAEPYNVTAAYTAALALTRAGKTDEGQRAMQQFEDLRDSPYGVTYSQAYLGQGRYGEALASTGAEADLVDPAPPGVTFSEAARDVIARPGSQAPAQARGGLTLFDADGDEALDLLVTGEGPLRFFRNDGGSLVRDEARFAAAGVTNSGGAIAGDYDNDGRADLFVLLQSGYALLRQREDGTFENVTSQALPGAGQTAQAAAFADVDHDGDLDVLTAGASLQLLRNNGDGTFTEMSAQAGVRLELGTAVGIAAVDFDNRRDVDILVAAGERQPALLRNMRDGTFRDAAGERGLPAASRYSALAVGDTNKDGYADVFLGRADAPGVLALSDERGGFRSVAAPDGTRGARAALFLDYDNDGLLDLVTLAGDGPRLFRNVGRGEWLDTTADAALDQRSPGDSAFHAMTAGDIDQDGDQDIVVRLSSGEVRVWRNDAPPARRSLSVRLAGRVSNRSGIGARIEIRAGSLRQMLEATSSTPAVTPAGALFGLGTRRAADVVRVLWPSGTLQAETDIEAPAPRTRSIEVSELDRKPSSCPYLFIWNGERFEFVTDMMGGGETGAWLAPSVWNVPDPDEYVRIREDQLRPRDGRYELRVTNELEEALFMDRLQLLAVDHPGGIEVHPNEGLRSPPRPPFQLTAVRDARPPLRAADGNGDDVLDALRTIDRRYAETFDLQPIRGYAVPHELVLDLGPVPGDPVLLMTGWTDYAFSNDNVAASQGGLVMRPPSLQVRNARGEWETALEEIGFPVGRPQTIVVDLAGRFPSGSREVRIVTNMRVYWDQVLVGVRDDSPLRLTRLDAAAADLRWRGFSAERTPDGREPYGYDYYQVSTVSPWKAMIGRYTREGDVRALLGRTDDMFVISQPGDEVAVSFRAPPPPRRGWSRTFLLYVHGYSKEMNPRSATPDTVAPLPFSAMSGYPYGVGEGYPRTSAHREYVERYNTRIVHRAVPSIDATALAADDRAGRSAGSLPDGTRR